jgi:hypothetical protein
LRFLREQGKVEIMAKRLVFISFDFNHDEEAKIMLAGQSKLEGGLVDIEDTSLK